MFPAAYVYSSIHFMRLRKSIIIVTSLLGVYDTVRRYQKKRRPLRVKRKQIKAQETNKYLQLSSSQVLEEFKNRIGAGEWLSQDEYTHMMHAMKNKDD